MASNSNRFSRLIMIVLLLSFICSLPGKASAETGKEIEEPASVFRAEPVANPPLEYLCSFVSLATYNDRVGLVAREALGDKGWVMQPYREDTKDIAAKYCFLKNSDFPDGRTRYLVSVMGTSDLKDVRTDLSMGKVPFAGHTPEEFLREMNRKTMKSSEPLTHGGFTKYTQTAFFTQKENGLTFGDELKKYLMEEPEAKLCVTGHSLGGAVAVLFAARLIAMGVPSEQIDVVTFGAPAVGNHAFGETYGGMRINRIVMARDPIEIAVQSVDRSYEQLGTLQIWKRPRGSERFMHDMTGYVDAALRLYYDDMTRKRRDVERFMDDGVPYEGDFMRAQEGDIEGICNPCG